jgi:ADP-ribose pyrophosphatase YjhB (NUDIX family)
MSSNLIASSVQQPQKLGVLLFAHGARTDSWRLSFDALRNMTQAQLSSVPVELAFLEFMQPDFAGGVQRLADLNCHHIRIELLFLAKGVHTLRDLTQLIDLAKLEHPHIDFSISKAMLEEPAILKASADWIAKDILSFDTTAVQMSQSSVTHNLQNRIAAGALIELDNRLLMVHHVKAKAYDFWSPPGGGVQALEDLKQTAKREVFEEVGLHIEVGALAYIEEFYQPGMRHLKSWFVGTLMHASITQAGLLGAPSPEARLEGIVEARFMSEKEIEQLPHFPQFVKQYWIDRNAGFTSPSYQRIRAMKFW